jgi:prepilin-type N-terminal cleavage/methylation domain-containing protein
MGGGVSGDSIMRINFGRDKVSSQAQAGFTLVEMLIAMTIMTLGLLAAGQMMYSAMASASLARSKGSAAIVAQDKLEFLADLYRQNSAAGDLTAGNHGPEQVALRNPINNRMLNRFNVTWTVATVPDPRGVVLKARQVTVTVTPIRTDSTTENVRNGQNKVVNVSAIFSQRAS